MKKKNIIATSIVLAFSSQLVIAGSITDTYSVGDTLTTTTLDNIKTAVNDNDSRLSSVPSTNLSNEPGVEYINFTTQSNTDVPVAYTSIQRMTVTAPTPGFVTCTATGSLDLDDASLTTEYITFGWDFNSNTVGVAPDQIGYVGISGGGTGSTYIPYTSMYTWPVSAGVNNFDFKVKTSTNDATDFDVFEGSYACIFYPTRY